MGWIVVALIAFIALGALVGPSSTKSGGSDIHGRVAGHMGHDSVGVAVSNSAAFDALSTSEVWCGWKGSDVVVHAVFTNSYGAGVKLDITPAYSLADAGDHGDASSITEEVPAGKTVTWLGDAGSPAGSPAPGTPITSCAPSINSVDLG